MQNQHARFNSLKNDGIEMNRLPIINNNLKGTEIVNQ
jgi:hypothetical protein